MRHRKAGRKLGRITAHRTAMLRNMVTSVLEHERIVTTVPKAKEARRIVDQMITRIYRERSCMVQLYAKHTDLQV